VNRLPAIVTELDLADDTFAVQVTVALPEATPLDGATVSHEPFPDVVQVPAEHPEGVPVIVTVVEPAPAAGLAEVGLIA
jgi:hypothetical protein